MKDPKKDQEFIASAKQALDRSLEDLEPHTLARLRQVRHQALEPARTRVPRFVWAGGLATAFATLLVASVVFYPTGSPNSVTTFDDVEILASSEDLDFYDDLEFYHWLADAEFSG